MLRLDGGINLRVLEFEEDLILTLLVCLLFKAVNWFSDFDGSQFWGVWFSGGRSGDCIACLSGRPSSKVGLMLFTLGVRHIASFI